MQYKELKGFRQILFTIGHIGPGMLNQFITTWILVFMSGEKNILLSASLVGISTMCGRIIDAVADPLVANWSDRLIKHKLGRRLPFIIFGTIPMVLSFNMIWYTQFIPGTVLRFIWTLFSINAFYFSYTMVVNPYFALLPEISKDKKQRAFLQSFIAVFGILGMGIAMGASGFLINAVGYQMAGLIMSIFCAVTLVGPVLTVRKAPDAPEVSADKNKGNIFYSVKEAFKNKSFRTYILGFCIFFLGFQLIQYDLAFITTVLLQLDKGMSSTLFIASVVSALALIPAYNAMLRKLTCFSALKVSISSYVIVAALIALTPLILNTGINGTILGFILMFLLGFPYAGLMILPNIIISEIIDEDVRENGIHREALFFGVQGLINKFMVAMASLIVGLVLDLFGNTIQNPYGVIIVAPIAAVIAAVGFLFIRRFGTGGEQLQ